MTTSSTLTAREVAQLFHLNEKTVWRLCKGGKWAHHYVGRKYIFTPEDVTANLALYQVTPVVAVADTWGRATRRKA